MKSIPERIRRLFWDVKKDEVHIDLHRPYIIRRIMDAENMEDVRWMLKTCSPEEIVEVVKKSRGLSRRSAWFWAHYFHISPEEVKCLKRPYEVSLLFPKIDYMGLKVADWRDIIAEKMETISQRGSKKDFYDLYAVMLSNRLSIQQAVTLFRNRFESTHLNLYHVLRSLTYFEDAEGEPDPNMTKGHRASWETVKSFFIANIKEFERSFASEEK